MELQSRSGLLQPRRVHPRLGSVGSVLFRRFPSMLDDQRQAKPGDGFNRPTQARGGGPDRGRSGDEGQASYGPDQEDDDSRLGVLRRHPRWFVLGDVAVLALGVAGYLYWLYWLIHLHPYEFRRRRPRSSRRNPRPRPWNSAKPRRPAPERTWSPPRSRSTCSRPSAPAPRRSVPRPRPSAIKPGSTSATRRCGPRRPAYQQALSQATCCFE